jgi:predicted phosphohydrolase
MEDMLENEGITSVKFLHNNAYLADGRIIAGTRGWFPDQKSQNVKTAGDADFEKISRREAVRLRQSLDAGVALRETGGVPDAEILVFFHFPPAFSDFESGELLDTMKEYGVKRCFYGHIHNVYDVPRTDERDSLRLSIISADYLNFIPLLIG